MRLRDDHIRQILRIVREHFGADARVSLFGSRLVDEARGGDVDLLIETSGHPEVMQRARAKSALEQTLLLPVDLIALGRDEPGTPYQRLVRLQAQEIREQTT